MNFIITLFFENLKNSKEKIKTKIELPRELIVQL